MSGQTRGEEHTVFAREKRNKYELARRKKIARDLLVGERITILEGEEKGGCIKSGKADKTWVFSDGGGSKFYAHSQKGGV